MLSGGLTGEPWKRGSPILIFTRHLSPSSNAQGDVFDIVNTRNVADCVLLDAPDSARPRRVPALLIGSFL